MSLDLGIGRATADDIAGLEQEAEARRQARRRWIQNAILTAAAAAGVVLSSSLAVLLYLA